MAREKDDLSLKEYQNRKKRYKQLRNIFFTVIILLAVIIGVSYIYMRYNRVYKNYEVVSTLSNTEENISGYIGYSKGMIRYSKDGAMAYDKSGRLLWNGSYEMLDPIIDTCSEYVAVADRGGKIIQIFNEKGQAGTFTMDYEIARIQIAKQGVFAVMMWNGDSNFVRLFDREGNLLAENKTVVQKDGYPIDIALSDDGTKLAVILLSVNRGKLTNNIAFYNYGEVGQNIKDRLAGDFGGFIYDEEEVLIPRIVFLNNDTVCVYKDNGFILYSMPELPSVIVDKTFDKKIRSVLHNSKYVGIVQEGESSNSSQLFLYNLKGELVLDKKLTIDYKNIYISGDEVVLYDDLNCMVIKSNGKVKFEYTFLTNISGFYPINHLDRYYMVSTNLIEEIRLLE